jgi:phosphoribosylanthranilate isomerase
VFVNKQAKDILKIAKTCQLDIVQLHGEETAIEFEKFPIPIWRAVHCNKKILSPSPSLWFASRYVVDSFLRDVYGGSGVICNWAAAAELAKKFPVMLSGGLTCGNVKEAIMAVNPLGVDVASGVEEVPGKKDKMKMKNFIAIAKGVKK